MLVFFTLQLEGSHKKVYPNNSPIYPVHCVRQWSHVAMISYLLKLISCSFNGFQVNIAGMKNYFGVTLPPGLIFNPNFGTEGTTFWFWVYPKSNHFFYQGTVFYQHATFHLYWFGTFWDILHTDGHNRPQTQSSTMKLFGIIVAFYYNYNVWCLNAVWASDNIPYLYSMSSHRTLGVAVRTCYML